VVPTHTQIHEKAQVRRFERREEEMKLEIENGRFVGTAEWRGPGDVRVEMENPEYQAWFERYFSTEDAFLTGPVECAEMSSERRDASEQAFQRAVFQLVAYDFRVRHADRSRTATAGDT
jgi:hypothetical protein